MKRQLLETTKVFPYTQGSAFDRLGFLSAVMGIRVDSADADTVAKITVLHCDTDSGTYEAVLDERNFLDKTQVKRNEKGNLVQTFVEIPVAAGDLLNLDIDLVGCAQFVKVNVEYTGTVSAAFAVALGDNSFNPPE